MAYPKADTDLAPPSQVPTEEERRDEDLFRQWMRGKSVKDLAKQFALSVSRVHGIAARDGWKRWRDRRRDRVFSKIVAELDRKPKKTAPNVRQVEGGEAVEVEIVLPPGLKSFGVFPTVGKGVRILEADFTKGIMRIETTFIGGWRSPFRSKRSIGDDFE